MPSVRYRTYLKLIVMRKARQTRPESLISQNSQAGIGAGIGLILGRNGFCGFLAAANADLYRTMKRPMRFIVPSVGQIVKATVQTQSDHGQHSAIPASTLERLRGPSRFCCDHQDGDI